MLRGGGVFFPFFRPVYVVRGCVRCCSRGCETPSAPLGLVPLRGGTVHSCRVGFAIPRTGVSGFAIRKKYTYLIYASRICFSESPFGLADSEIRIPHCAGLQIRRSVSAWGLFILAGFVSGRLMISGSLISVASNRRARCLPCVRNNCGRFLQSRIPLRHNRPRSKSCPWRHHVSRHQCGRN